MATNPIFSLPDGGKARATHASVNGGTPFPLASVTVAGSVSSGGGGGGGGGFTGTRMLGVYTGDNGEASLATFGRYPDCTSNYFQHSQSTTTAKATLTTQISRGITPFVTLSFKDYLNADDGDPATDSTRPNAYSVIAAGRAANPTAYDTAIAVIDKWATMLEEVATATATKAKGITVYACLDSEPDAKTNPTNSNGLVINATVGNETQIVGAGGRIISNNGVPYVDHEMGKFFNVGSQRFKELAPSVPYGIWFAQQRKTQIIQMLGQMSAGSVDWLSADPYNNGTVAPTVTVEKWSTTISTKWTDWFRNDPSGEYARLGKPPLAVTEFGISNGAAWKFGAGPREHTDAQIADYYTDLRTQMASAKVDVFAAILFDRERDKDHRITGSAAPLSPKAVAAFKASLEADPV